jgi:hypothetical protein
MQALPVSMTSPIGGKKTRQIRNHHVYVTRILWPTYASNPPQIHMGSRKRLEDPPDSDLEKAQHGRGHPGVGRHHRSAELPLARVILAFHVWAPGWFLAIFRGARGVSRSCPAAINKIRGCKKRITYLKETSHLCLLLPTHLLFSWLR